MHIQKHVVSHYSVQCTFINKCMLITNREERSRSLELKVHLSYEKYVLVLKWQPDISHHRILS